MIKTFSIFEKTDADRAASRDPMIVFGIPAIFKEFINGLISESLRLTVFNHLDRGPKNELVLRIVFSTVFFGE